MTVGATRDYSGGAKKHWRRTVWNEVLRRTAGRERTECVLYLAGPKDFDRGIARDKGVPDENLIAIDRAGVNVVRVRDGRHPAVEGDALDVLWSWPEGRPVCAVLLDFCSGLEFSNIGVYDAFERPCLRRAVVMVNFMRGRDPWSNPLRIALGDAGLLHRPGAPALDVPAMSILDWADPKHRAYQFLLFHAWDLVSGMMTGQSFDEGVVDGRRRMALPANAAQGEWFRSNAALFLTAMLPSFYSYQSGTLRFDSVVFQSHCRIVDEVAPEVLPVWMRRELVLAQGKLVARAREFKNLGIVRRIGAMLAIRTQRARRSRGVC